VNPPNTWVRHRLEYLGFSVDVLEGLPVETWQRPTGGGVFQILEGEDSSLFVNWGESASLEGFRQSLSDLNTRAVDVRQWPVEVLGARGQRLSATVEQGAIVAYGRSPEGVVTHAESPAACFRTEAISFACAGVPVLVGYRVAQSTVREYEPLLKHFLASVRPLEG
jgi:hypothetical protein